MADRNRELVPDNWSLVRERALTTGLQKSMMSCSHKYKQVFHREAATARISSRTGETYEPRGDEKDSVANRRQTEKATTTTTTTTTTKFTHTVGDVPCFINLAPEVADFGGEVDGIAHVFLAVLLGGGQVGADKLGLTASVLRWDRKESVQG